MTKRFKFNGATNCIEYDGKSILLDSYGEDIEELLNGLHEKNLILLRKNGAMEEEIECLSEENHSLHNQIGKLTLEKLLLKRKVKE